VAAGYQVVLADVNNTAGRLTVALRDAFIDVVTFKTWLDSQTDAVLLAAPIGMVQADINILRSAMADLKQLNDIRTSAANLAVAKDFMAFAKQLTGVL
jgi:hypothetical protein